MMHSFIVLTLLLLPMVCSAEIYKWRDENGKLHFSDKPAENSQKITLPKTNSFPVQENTIETKIENESKANLTHIFGSYYLEESSFSHRPAWVENKQSYNRFQETWSTFKWQHYDSWSFNIIKGKTKYKCYLSCGGSDREPRAKLSSSGNNFPGGVERYFTRNFCPKNYFSNIKSNCRGCKNP